MRVFPYLIGAFVSLLAGLAIGWLSGSFGIGVVASVAVFLVSAGIVRDRRERGDEAARVHARDAALYSQVGHGGRHFDGGVGGGSDGGGGGCDGGGGF